MRAPFRTSLISRVSAEATDCDPKHSGSKWKEEDDHRGRQMSIVTAGTKALLSLFTHAAQCVSHCPGLMIGGAHEEDVRLNYPQNTDDLKTNPD